MFGTRGGVLLALLLTPLSAVPVAAQPEATFAIGRLVKMPRSFSLAEP